MHSRMKKPASSPKNWPTNVKYLTNSSYHTSVSAETRLRLRNDCLTPSVQLQPSHGRPPVLIRPISDPSHPAYGQFGLFAASKISANQFLVEYAGEIHCDDRLESDYDLSLHRFQDGISVGIDATEMGNEARFINDYRGIGVKPNAIFKEVKTRSGELGMTIWSCREIKKGEEILVSYGKAWWNSRQSGPEPQGALSS